MVIYLLVFLKKEKSSSLSFSHTPQFIPSLFYGISLDYSVFGMTLLSMWIEW